MVSLLNLPLDLIASILVIGGVVFGIGCILALYQYIKS